MHWCVLNNTSRDQLNKYPECTLQSRVYEGFSPSTLLCRVHEGYLYWWSRDVLFNTHQCTRGYPYVISCVHDRYPSFESHNNQREIKIMLIFVECTVDNLLYIIFVTIKFDYFNYYVDAWSPNRYRRTY